jgi:hypothetical protein
MVISRFNYMTRKGAQQSLLIEMSSMRSSVDKITCVPELTYIVAFCRLEKAPQFPKIVD